MSLRGQTNTMVPWPWRKYVTVLIGSLKDILNKLSQNFDFVGKLLFVIWTSNTNLFLSQLEWCSPFLIIYCVKYKRCMFINELFLLIKMH